MIKSDKMRLFVNVELSSWQSAIHLTTCSRLYSGKWMDYHIYKVKEYDNDGNLNLVSFSPMKHLKKLSSIGGEFDKYYCYYGYKRWPIYEDTGFTLTRVKLHGPINNDISESPLIKVPTILDYNDRLVVYDPDEGNAINPIIGILGMNNSKPELA